MIINLHGVYPSTSLYARKLWQELFNIYQQAGGNLNRLDNLLIDYNNFIDYFGSYKPFVFYWHFYKEGPTSIKQFCDTGWDGAYKVQYNRKEIQISDLTDSTEYEETSNELFPKVKTLLH